MELTKADKRQLKDIIRRGILRRCEEWLKETSELINKEYGDDENAFDRCMEVTKRSRDYFKEAMRREDYYRNTILTSSMRHPKSLKSFSKSKSGWIIFCSSVRNRVLLSVPFTPSVLMSILMIVFAMSITLSTLRPMPLSLMIRSSSV